MPQEGRVSYRDLLVTQQPRGYTHEFLWFPKGRQGCGGRSYKRPHRDPMAQRVRIYLGPMAPEVSIEPYGATGNHMAHNELMGLEEPDRHRGLHGPEDPPKSGGREGSYLRIPGQKPRATTDSCLIVTQRSLIRHHWGLREYPVMGAEGPPGTACTPGYLFVVYYILTIGRSNTSSNNNTTA